MIGRLLAVGALFGALCSAAVVHAADASKTVKVFMYSEYIDPEMVKDFQKQTGMTYQIDTYENSEEMLAKMQQGGGASQYDCVVVSDAHVPTLVKLGLVKELDQSKIPNAKNADPMFVHAPFDPDAKYSVPYQWGTVGLIYDKAKVKGDISWSMIFESSKQPGPFVLMDSMRDMIGIGLKYNGFSMNSRKPAEIKKSMDSLIAAKGSKKCLGMEGGVGGKNRVAAGEAALAVVYNGDAVRALSENKNLGFAVPKEGGVIWVDVMLVPAKAPNAAGGHAFINFIMDPTEGAKLSNFNRYPTPNKAAMPQINADDKANTAIYPPETTMKTLEYLTDVGTDTKLYDEAWTAIKAQ